MVATTWDIPGPRSAVGRGPWADVVEAGERAEAHGRGFLATSWLVMRFALCIGFFGLCVSGPIGANLAQSAAKGWFWVTLSFASAIIAPCLVSSAFSRNNDLAERMLAALLVLFFFAWDWSNAASNNAATSDTQLTTSENERTAEGNVTKERKRLNDAYDAQVLIAGCNPIAKLEADKKMATDKSNAAWETYTQNSSRKATRRYARMPSASLRDAITAVDIKLAAARERDRIDGERKRLVDVAALPSQADATIDAFQRAFTWLGFHFEDKTVARIISWWNGGFMQTMGLLGPHFAFIYLFKTLSPEASERRRLRRFAPRPSGRLRKRQPEPPALMSSGRPARRRRPKLRSGSSSQSRR